VAPGSGYGAHGEGYVRFSLTVPDDRLAEAMDRIGTMLTR
jgi:aspartate/methionine/tyrosine aminotransferase